MAWRPHLLPLLLAVVVTGLNALKPAVVDDTAYLLFARHLAADPAHPYRFDLFWYHYPEPAMNVLAPPVLPYWLAAGIALFGEHLVLLKLWLFPFAWVLCVAVRSLLRRFAPAVEREGLIALALSPAVLALFSVMLDVPALALGAGAVALFVKGCDGGSVWRAGVAGVLAAVAMQTKYSMLVVPAVQVGYALTRLGKPERLRVLALTALAVAMAVGLFVAWERYVVEHDTERRSHFLFHLKESAGGGELGERIMGRLAFAQPLLSQFGGLAVGVSVAAAAGLGWPRWVRVGSAVAAGGGLVLVCSLSHTAGTPFGEKLSVPFLVFAAMGASVAVSALYGLSRAFLHHRTDADTLFLAGWVMVEVVGMLGMTPFPAARRTIGVCLAVAVLLFHLAGRLLPDGVKLPRWGVAFAAAVGLVVWAVDCWDAQPEKVLAEKAAEMARPGDGGTVWFTGHWGFQYHCDRAGMKPLITKWDGRTDHTSSVKAGDRLVLPVLAGYFVRPWPADHDLPRPGMALEELAVFEWEDGVRGQTVPNLYGGSVPIAGRDHPRLRVAVYRVLRDWP